MKTWERRWLPLADFVVEEIRDIVAGRDPEDLVPVAVRGAAVEGKNWYNRVWLKARQAIRSAPSYSVRYLRHVAVIAAGTEVKLVQLI